MVMTQSELGCQSDLIKHNMTNTQQDVSRHRKLRNGIRNFICHMKSHLYESNVSVKMQITLQLSSTGMVQSITLFEINSQDVRKMTKQQC